MGVKMKRRREWIPGEWIWGYDACTNERVCAQVSNANGLLEGYVWGWVTGKSYLKATP